MVLQFIYIYSCIFFFIFFWSSNEVFKSLTVDSIYLPQFLILFLLILSVLYMHQLFYLV